MKECTNCRMTKPLDDFYKHSTDKSRHRSACKKCAIRYVREHKKDTGYNLKMSSDNKRDTTVLLDRRYKNILYRCTSPSSSRFGMEYLSKDEFVKWTSETMEQFLDLYQKWQEAKYDPRLQPSVDRVDASKGYIVGNIQWLTLSQNATKNVEVDNPGLWKKAYKARLGREYDGR